MKKVVLLALAAMLQMVCWAAGLTVNNLRVDGLTNPIGVDKEQPLFSWTVYDGDLKRVKQTQYRVQIFKDARCTKRVWDSRSQRNTSDTWIIGPVLDGVGTKYYWRVTVNDDRGRQATSKTAWFITGLNDTGWDGAQWLKAKRQDDSRQTGAPVMRKQLALDSKKRIMNARVYASALGVFDLFLNGERLGREDSDGLPLYDELKPGFTSYQQEVHYLTFDITDKLFRGSDNMLGVQLSNGWWSGEVTANINGKKDLAFMAKVQVMYADSTVQTFVTDETWETNNCGPLLYGDIYNGETYDARRDYSWTVVGDNSQGWRQAEAYDGYDVEPTAQVGPQIVVRKQFEQTVKGVTVWQGTKQTGTQYGEIDVKATIAGGKQFTLHKGETAIFDLGQNITGWPEFTVKGKSGAEITCRFGEMLNDNGDPAHINDGPAGSVYTHNMRSAKTTLRYILAGGKPETYHPSATFFGFRYVSMTATDDVTIVSLKGQVVGSDIDETAEFECSDERVNKLYQNIRWSARDNFLSIPTDCPQRDERLGWTGDTQIFSRTACYTGNMRAFYHKWMSDLRNCQREDGAISDTAPLGRYGAFGNAGWAEAVVIVPWNVYLMYNDTGILEDNYDAMRLFMLWMQGNTTDDYLYNGAGTDYGDWLAYDELDPRFVSVCYYAYTADLMSRIGSIIGIEDEPEQYAALAKEIRKEFRKRYMTDDHLTQTTQTAYVLALHFNMLEGEAQYENAKADLRRKIVDNGYRLSTGFIGTAYLCPTLSEYGMTDLAYTLLLQNQNPSWLYEVENGATTVWERWDSFKAGEGFNKHEWNMNSFNHYAYGVVAEWIYRDMAGIEPDVEQPGFQHIIIAPKPDMRTDDQIPAGQKRIDWMRCSVPTPYGKVTSAWERQKNGKIRYDIIVPFNAKATFYEPKTDGTYEEHELECGKWSF